jgi:hypothetical protein
VGSGKLEQAAKLYTQMMETPLPDDYLNYGFCKWLSGQIVEAAELFRQYDILCSDKGFDFDAEAEFRREKALLQRHGIGDVEIQLMIDHIKA